MIWHHHVVDTYDPELVLPLAEAKRELDIDHSDHDELITDHITAALDWVEKYVGRFMGPVTIAFVADRIPARGLLLPFAPVSTVTQVSVGGEPVADFVQHPGAPGLILAPLNHYWPRYAGNMGDILVTYGAGYPIGECPKALIQGAKLMVGLFYDKSTDMEKDTKAVENLIRSYRFQGAG